MSMMAVTHRLNVFLLSYFLFLLLLEYSLTIPSVLSCLNLFECIMDNYPCFANIVVRVLTVVKHDHVSLFFVFMVWNVLCWALSELMDSLLIGIMLFLTPCSLLLLLSVMF